MNRYRCRKTKEKREKSGPVHRQRRDGLISAREFERISARLVVSISTTRRILTRNKQLTIPSSLFEVADRVRDPGTSTKSVKERNCNFFVSLYGQMNSERRLSKDK